MKRDSVLLFWVSGKSLLKALELLVKWDYEFVNFLLVWVKLTKASKLKLGLGFWTRNNVELLILAKRG